MLLKYIIKLLKVLGSEGTPRGIAGGVMLGSFLGLAPLFCGHNLVVIALVFLVNVNVASVIFAWGLFRFLRLIIDPLSDALGYAVLTIDSLEGFYTALYNTAPFATSDFNNTIVMGGLIISLVIAAPLYFGIKRFVPYYREHLMERVNNWKIVRFLKMSKVFVWYRRVT